MGLFVMPNFPVWGPGLKPPPPETPHHRQSQLRAQWAARQMVAGTTGSTCLGPGERVRHGMAGMAVTMSRVPGDEGVFALPSPVPSHPSIVKPPPWILSSLGRTISSLASALALLTSKNLAPRWSRSC